MSDTLKFSLLSGFHKKKDSNTDDDKDVTDLKKEL